MQRKYQQKADNPIILVIKIATALFKEFWEETDELDYKGNKKWKLPDIQDGVPFRITLDKILKKYDCDVDKAIEDAIDISLLLHKKQSKKQKKNKIQKKLPKKHMCKLHK